MKLDCKNSMWLLFLHLIPYHRTFDYCFSIVLQLQTNELSTIKYLIAEFFYPEDNIKKHSAPLNSMEADSNWQLFHQAIEVCLERGDIEKAKIFLEQLYVSIGLYHSEEQDDEVTSEAYNVCLAEALQVYVVTDIVVVFFLPITICFLSLNLPLYIHVSCLLETKF